MIKFLPERIKMLALSTGLLTSAQLLQAQIVYKDLHPDKQIFGNQSTFIDMDNDGVNEFSLELFVNSTDQGKTIRVIGLNSAGYITKFANTIVSSKLDANTVISSSNTTGDNVTYLGVLKADGTPENIWAYIFTETQKNTSVG
jgi:hypothetical protein